MTVPCDLVNHEKMDVVKISRKGKSMKKLVMLPILRPLSLRCAIKGGLKVGKF